jgi:hypothetical protein
MRPPTRTSSIFAATLRVGEGLGQHRLVRAAGVRQPALPQGQPVEARLAAFRHGHQLADHRLVESRDVEHGRAHDAGLDGLDAGNLAQPAREVFRRALDPREHVAAGCGVARGSSRRP